ncbi:MAG: serine hydrolase [Candidatus Paceibacterota bacterium]|jgi:D-alanyl-D-alanine carboxypeptidase
MQTHISHKLSVTLIVGVCVILLGILFLIIKYSDKTENKDLYSLASVEGSFLNIPERYFVSNVGANEQRPVASVTKLLTALVVYEKHQTSLASETVTIDYTSEAQPGDIIQLHTGDTYKMKDIIKAMLIGSSNDAAYAVASHFGYVNFVSDMNLVAHTIGMKDSFFSNPTGLDNVRPNSSTPHDLAMLVDYIYEQYPEILSFTRTLEYVLADVQYKQIQTIYNTDILLQDVYLGPKIIGSKTGSTGEARQTLVILATNRDGKGKPVVFIVLGSEDRFTAMKTLMDNYYRIKRPGIGVAP